MITQYVKQDGRWVFQEGEFKPWVAESNKLDLTQCTWKAKDNYSTEHRRIQEHNMTYDTIKSLFYENIGPWILSVRGEDAHIDTLPSGVGEKTYTEYSNHGLGAVFVTVLQNTGTFVRRKGPTRPGQIINTNKTLHKAPSIYDIDPSQYRFIIRIHVLGSILHKTVGGEKKWHLQPTWPDGGGDMQMWTCKLRL